MAQPILVHYKLLYSTPALFTKEQSEIHSMPISLVGFCFFGSQIQTIVEYIGEKRGKSGDESMGKENEKKKKLIEIGKTKTFSFRLFEAFSRIQSDFSPFLH